MNKITSELLNIKQAAAFLGVNPGTIRRWALANTLKGIKVGSRGDWRFKEEELLKLTKSNYDNRLSPLRPRSEASKKQ